MPPSPTTWDSGTWYSGTWDAEAVTPTPNMPTQNISATFTAQQLIDLKDDIEALAPQFPTLVTLTEAERRSLPRGRFPPGR